MNRLRETIKIFIFYFSVIAVILGIWRALVPFFDVKIAAQREAVTSPPAPSQFLPAGWWIERDGTNDRFRWCERGPGFVFCSHFPQSSYDKAVESAARQWEYWHRKENWTKVEK